MADAWKSFFESRFPTYALGQLPNDPCANLIPPNVPSGESVDNNIITARNEVSRLRKEAQDAAAEIRRTGGLGSGGAAAMMELAVGQPGGAIDRWFEGMVANKKEWDYKWRDPEGIKIENSKYEDFGNFNYGAVGASIGYPLGTLQRMAGWVQKTRREGESPLTIVQARSGLGGTYPYGDQRKDAEQIARGYEYYNCRRKNPR